MFSVESVQKTGARKSEGRGCNKWSVLPNQLNAMGTALIHCVSTLQRTLTLCLTIGYDQLQNAAEEVVELQS